MDKITKEKVDDMIHRILRQNHTEKGWLELEEDYNKLVKGLSKELENKIIDSGAGEVLYMICSGIRYEETQAAS